MVLVKETYLMIAAFIFTELLMQFMLLWLLKLFISKLFIMLNFSLKTVNPLKTDLSLYKNFRKMLGENLSKRRLDEANDPKLDMMTTSIDRENEAKNRIPMDHDAEFVNIMSKMTLLVIVGVIGCALSIFGHILIAIYELNAQPNKAAWIILQSLSILFPIIDRVLASFMLYLQFKQTERVYLQLCGRMDDYVLLCGLKCVQWRLKRNNIKYDKDINVKTLTTRTSKSESKDKKNHLDIPNKGRLPNSNSESSRQGHATHGTLTDNPSITLSLPVAANLDAIVEEENTETAGSPLRLDLNASSSTYDMSPIDLDKQIDLNETKTVYIVN